MTDSPLATVSVTAEPLSASRPPVGSCVTTIPGVWLLRSSLSRETVNPAWVSDADAASNG